MPRQQKLTTLRDQLELNAADLEARFEADPRGSLGRDWYLLSEAEEDIFAIDRNRFPRMVTTHECYQAFKLMSDNPSWDETLIQHERQKRPGWCGAATDELEFCAFAKALGGLTNREANAVYWKQHFWTIRLGVMTFWDEQPNN